ncbi:MAG: RNA-binding protein [Geminicoccaceae bacterium]
MNDEAAEPSDDDLANPRRCLVDRTAKHRDALIRFVIGPDATLVPDFDERLPGRGLWLSADREVVKKAVASHVFARAAKQRIIVPAGLLDQLVEGLHGRCLQLLGLARRAGELDMGFEQVRRGVKAGSYELLVIASDAADDGLSKLSGVAIDRVSLLDREAMGRAVGRDKLVYAGLATGGLARRFRVQAVKLHGLAPSMGTIEVRTPRSSGEMLAG